VSPLRGYTAPLSPDGRAGIVPAPPWHYVGDFTLVEYRADPDAVAALLPPELEADPDDPGAMAAIFADWQSCTDDCHELADPVRCQYKELFLVVACAYQGEKASRCVYIWVDKDFAMYRGWIQGFPKKLGEIHMTRSYPFGIPGAPLQPGTRFGATCTANGRQIARAVVTLTGVSEGGPTVNAPPMHNTRHFPAYDGFKPDVFELVRGGGYDRQVSEVWEGDAELCLSPDTIEDLRAIAPLEVGKGFRYSFAYSVHGGEVVAQHDKEALRP
jgi:acetoacetate decarboxylase